MRAGHGIAGEARFQDVAGHPAVQAFVEAAEALVARDRFGSAAALICERLRELGQDPDILEAELATLHGSGAAATAIGRGRAGSVLMLARFLPDAETPVHNHNTWGVVCVVRGRDRYRRWERLDDGSDPHHARLQLAEERELAAGEVITFGAPPHDIHSQQGIGEAAWELVYFGNDPNAQPRSYFDTAAGTVRQASAM